MAKTAKALDVVRLVQEFNGFPVGTEGTIVHKYDDSMYEIEFFDKSGNPLEVVTDKLSIPIKITALNTTSRNYLDIIDYVE